MFPLNPQEKADQQQDDQMSYRQRKFEALCILFTDRHGINIDAVITAEDLDNEPLTAMLPQAEKDLLLKHWPKFQRDQRKALQIIELRKQETEAATKALKGAQVMSTEFGLDSMAIGDKLEATAAIFHTQIQKAALSLAATDIEDLHTDPMLRELYKMRLNYVKDFMFVAKGLVDLSQRLRESGQDKVAAQELPAETKVALQKANALLALRGVKNADQFDASRDFRIKPVLVKKA